MWLIIAGLISTLLLTTAGVAAFLVYGFWNTISYKPPTNFMPELSQALGKKFDPKTLPLCTSHWQIDTANDTATCPLLSGKDQIAHGGPIAITAYLDKDQPIRAFGIRIPIQEFNHQPDPQIPVARQTWLSLAIAKIPTPDCKQIPSNIPDSTIFQCDTIAYGFVAAPKDHSEGYLWIGKSAVDFQNHYEQTERLTKQ